MADTVRVQVLQDGPRNAVVLCTNESDGTGEAAVVKVNLATTFSAPPPGRVRIKRLRYSTSGMAVKILWDAAVDQLAWTITTDGSGFDCFNEIGGLSPPDVAGLTGNILFTTVGHTSGDSYAIVLELVKD